MKDVGLAPQAGADTVTVEYLEGRLGAIALTPVWVDSSILAVTTAVENSLMIVDATVRAVTMLMPSAAPPGRIIAVQKTDPSAHLVQVQPAAGQGINGDTAGVELAEADTTITLLSDGVGWRIWSTALTNPPVSGGGGSGAAGTVAVGTVTTGAPGSGAAVANTGTPSAAVLDFTIPRGDPGTAGAAATVAVGTVITGAPGSQAAVANAGTSAAAVLDITIPRGDPGAAGVTPAFTVGTVTALAPGATPTVTQTGPPEAPVLNFGIPQGTAGGGSFVSTAKWGMD